MLAAPPRRRSVSNGSASAPGHCRRHCRSRRAGRQRSRPDRDSPARLLAVSPNGDQRGQIDVSRRAVQMQSTPDDAGITEQGAGRGDAAVDDALGAVDEAELMRQRLRRGGKEAASSIWSAAPMGRKATACWPGKLPTPQDDGALRHRRSISALAPPSPMPARCWTVAPSAGPRGGQQPRHQAVHRLG